MTYCSGQTKAIVILKFKNGTEERILSSKPPVSIQKSSGVGGIKTIYLRGFAYAGGSQCRELPGYEERHGTLPANVTPTLRTGSGGTCGGGSSIQYIVNEIGFNSGTEWARGSVSIRQEYDAGNCNIKITDQSGTIYEKSISQACPEHEVSCGDECPEGYIKCECFGYPGYCCIPCSEIKSEIKGLTSIVRGINNG